jgi:hypothetical protein
MVVVTLDAAALERAREHPNYQLRTRRPELFAELVTREPKAGTPKPGG